MPCFPGTEFLEEAGGEARLVILSRPCDGHVAIAHVALNLFTNYINVALDVPVDFPRIALRQAA